MFNKSAFEKGIRESIGEFEVQQTAWECYQYTIVNGRDPSYQSIGFFIGNRGMEGIRITFYNTFLKRMQSFDHIYHWSDAYEILYLGLTRPEALRYQDENGEILAVGRTLGRPRYEFTWQPSVEQLWDFGDQVMESAIQLVLCRYIKKVEYLEEEDQIRIEGRICPCGADMTLERLAEEMHKEFFDGQGEDHKEWAFCRTGSSRVGIICGNPGCYLGSDCILDLCGYLEYAANQEMLAPLLEERAKRREAYRKPCGEYQFTWQPEQGLKVVDESRYCLALQLARQGQIEVEKELTEENRVKISASGLICGFDGEDEVTTCRIASAAAGIKEGQEKDMEFTIPVTRSLQTRLSGGACDRCINRCVYFYAGYIKYLLDCGKENVIREDREWFRQNQKNAESKMQTEYQFILPDDLFLDQPEELFEAAELLQERNYVSLYRGMADDGEGNRSFRIETVQGIVNRTSDDLKMLKQEVLEEKIDRTQRMSCYLYDFSANFEPLKAYVVLAGYIDYLRRTGRYTDYQRKLASQRLTTARAFDSAAEEIPKLEKVLAIAENEKESGLYCVIQGERGVGKRRIVEQIARLLAQKGKINSSEYEIHTFDDMASILSYRAMYDLGCGAAEDQFVVYSDFEPRKLYVLTDLKEFLYNSAKAEDGDSSKVSHLIKLLGRYQPQTYIVVIGEEKYVERFLELSPKIRFLFENNVIPIVNLTPVKMYEAFVRKLSERLKSQLTEGFKNRFLDYIALNRRFLPLGNQELADYLADYANNQKELCLPPDVYRKQSAEEMLESVIGMENVKKKTCEFEAYAMFMKRAQMDGMHLPDSNMHMIFTGNPGTGKTMIARVIAQMLFDLGIVKENRLTEVEAKDLKSPYIGDSAGKTGGVISKAMGGVLFIDEAYSIGDDAHGKEVIATLIKAMEDYKDRFVVIFAGYAKEMQDFLNINPGIASRIGYTFDFEDYTAEELTQIFDRKMKKAGFIYGPEILDQVRDICAYFREKKNYGNGRFVDKLIQRVIIKHASAEVENAALRKIRPEDIPEIEELISTDVVEHKNYEEQLAAFIGMEPVKEKVRQFARFAEFQQMAKAAGASIPAGNMHMIFTGNPGTGKTAIARVMVELLYDIGVIKENKLVEAERKDLVAGYVGQTGAKTAEVIERALGGVLFIDEAYTLTPTSENDFGGEAIATLLKAMEDHKNDLIVIFAGYQEEMRQFVNTNPGIASRIGNVFDFPDYTPSELAEMYRTQMEKAGFAVTGQALEKVEIVMEYFSGKKNFGNGRFVGKMVQETFLIHSGHVRPDQANLTVIDGEDIPEITDLTNTGKKMEKSTELDRIVGLSGVKEKMKELEALVNFGILAKEHGLNVPSANMHMIFTGNPGTGKTTIARIIAGKLYDIGIIKEKKLVEAERKDLIAGYVGQTALKVGEVVEKAMGGILFIDEAYTLTPKTESDFGGEAIAALIKAMEDHKEDLIVIFAGYKEEMEEFVDANPGIASRIGFTFHFEDYTAEELCKIFVKKMEANGFTVTEKAEEKVKTLMQESRHRKNFGNGRFVDRAVQQTITIHAQNYTLESIAVIDERDIPDGVKEG